MTLPAAAPTRRLILLGSTGSIGVNALAVVEHLRRQHLREFEVVGLAAGSNASILGEQARRLGVQHVAIADERQASLLSGIPHVYRGPDAALELISDVARPGDLVLGAMVGSAGVPATIAAIERGCDIALANKETLVAAGAIVMPKVRQRGVHLIPVDSEHSAIFQCLQHSPIHRSGSREDQVRSAPSPSGDTDEVESSGAGYTGFDVARIVLTASGGPFRTWTRQRMDSATVEEALNHPTWNMGPKVTIDSASLMNKALEVIEAHWLFNLPAEKIDVLIHPQSIVHSFVEFVDGSVLAQLGPPDMRTPIQYALTWPERVAGCSRQMHWAALGRMDFEAVDRGKFMAPQLAYRVIESGGTAGAIFNAANESAVTAFLERRIPFGQIAPLVDQALQAISVTAVHTLDDIYQADQAARRFVSEKVNARECAHAAGSGSALGSGPG